MRNLITFMLLALMVGPVNAQQPEGAFESLLLEIGASVMNNGFEGDGPWRQVLDNGQIQKLKAMNLRPDQVQRLISLVVTFGPQLLDPEANAAGLVDQLTPLATSILDQDQRQLLADMDVSPAQLQEGIHWVRNEVSQMELPSREVLSEKVLRQTQDSLPEGYQLLRDAFEFMLLKASQR